MRGLAGVALCVLALAGCDSDPEPERAAPIPRAKLAGAPAPLAALHEQANELLDGGTDGFKARLRALRGYPVVVNAWGSWCTPCRAEFPHFREQGIERAKTIGFLGVDVQDADRDALEFLREQPVPYPSFRDPDGKIAALFGAVQGLPSTAFYDKRGRLAYLHQGPYRDERQLAEDIDRYAR
jgi:cytochrome c biogenesis protein CcmG, thiol:disulfide interchange protein DsbE